MAGAMKEKQRNSREVVCMSPGSGEIYTTTGI